MRVKIPNQIKKFVLRTINKLGYRIEKINRQTEYSSIGNYKTMLLESAYAPWIADGEFQHVYQIIKNNTLVNENRCYEIWQLVEQALKANGSLIEVGVWKGGTS